MVETPLPHQIGLSVAIVYAIEFLKRSRWFPWLTISTDGINQWVNFFAAFAAGFGIHATLHMDGASGTLIVAFPTQLAEVAHLATFVLTQWGIQMAYYRQVVKVVDPRAETPAPPKTAIAA
jgi:hypothetical protein